MKRMVKQAAALFLVIVLLAGVWSWAVDSNTNADRLNALGLFKGTGNGYELEGTATRIQGLVMLIRLMGEEDEALACTSANPFEDVTNELYARYAAYGYAKGYANGISANAYNPDGKLDFKSYITFLLRALGYDDKAGDFSWERAPEKAAQIGLTDSASASFILNNNPTLYRADIVDLSYSALTYKFKDGSKTMAEKLIGDGVFTRAQAQAQGVLNGNIPFAYTNRDYSTISRETNTYSLPSGKVKADVVTVNTLNPKVKVKTFMVNNTLGATDSFSNIVKNSGAAVIVNGNFFESYQKFQKPIGHVMSSGQFLYGMSGLHSFGFTESGEIKVGQPALFFHAVSADYKWACYNLNYDIQGQGSIMYTPAFGSSVSINAPGTAVTVEGGIIQSVQTVNKGDSLPIPSNGYVMHFGPEFTSTTYYKEPTVGTAVTLVPELFRPDDNGFTLDGVTEMVSGSPRLVKQGEICMTLDEGFNESRFTTASTPRTALGKLSNGKLVIVSTGAATIQQMRELMLQLGCVEAVNLDGGGSTSFAWQGQIVRSPGRNLTTTLQVFVEQ